ncbi:MAG TPA: C45 family peptidase [Pirellulales bacterium]
MSRQTRYREIEVAGTPWEMGRQIGEAAGDEIRGFSEAAWQHIGRTLRMPRDRALAIAAAAIPFAEQYSPSMVDELRGTAEAVGLKLEDLMLLQVRNQLRPEPDAGCTSLAMDGRASAGSGSLVAQNWDNDPALDPFTIVLTRRPAGKPALLNLTQAGLIAYIGFNEAGLGVCLNSLPAPTRTQGVPHYFTVRGIYEADSLGGAVDSVRRARRVIPANIMLTTPQGPADLEVTIDDVHVLQNADAGGIAHTNHCLHPALQSTNEQFPELIQSHARQQRIDSLLNFSSAHRPSVPDIQAALGDHEGYPHSICRHANDDPNTGTWQTVFSVIIEPDERRMYVSRGTPCDHAYEEYQLS